MEPRLQAGPAIVPSAMLRLRRFHKASSSSETRMLGSQAECALLTAKSPRANYRGGDLWGSVGPHSGSPQSSFRHLTLPPHRTWILASPQLKPRPLYQDPSLLKTRMSGSQHMPVVLILPPRLPWTDNRDGLL